MFLSKPTMIMFSSSPPPPLWEGQNEKYRPPTLQFHMIIEKFILKPNPLTIYNCQQHKLYKIQ